MKIIKQIARLFVITVFITIFAISNLNLGNAHANSSYYQYNGQFVWYSQPISDSSSELYTADPNGDNVRRVTTDGTQNGNPQWYPDGSRIIYDRPAVGLAGNSSNHSLFIIDKNGANQKMLLQSNFSGGYNSGYLYDASFNPDGTKIAFHQSDPANSNLSKIFIASYDYGTNTIGTPAALGGSGYIANTFSYTEPIWSRDGTQITAARATAGSLTNLNIVVMNATSGVVAQVTTDGGWGGSPQFAPDKDLVVNYRTTD